MVQPGTPPQTPSSQSPGRYPPNYFPPSPKKKPVWPWVLGVLALLVVLMFAGCVALIGTAASVLSR